MKKGSRNRQVVFVKWAEPTSRDALSTLQEKKDTLCWLGVCLWTAGRGREGSTLTVADYVASNDWLVMNWKNFVGKWPWPTSSFPLEFVWIGWGKSQNISPSTCYVILRMTWNTGKHFIRCGVFYYYSSWHIKVPQVFKIFSLFGLLRISTQCSKLHYLK